jgi:hypothetical protein
VVSLGDEADAVGAGVGHQFARDITPASSPKASEDAGSIGIVRCSTTMLVETERSRNL